MRDCIAAASQGEKEMKNDHPPIPPNNSFFKKGCFRFDGKWLIIDDVSLRSMKRPIIAAVARCAWLDEAMKWAKCPVNDCKNFDSIAEYKADAESNAEAWRVWGLAK